MCSSKIGMFNQAMDALTTPTTTTTTTTTTTMAPVVETPECSATPNWHAGYGSCDTYAPGLITNGAENYAYCDLDKSRTGVMASETCEECGQCSISNPSTLASTSTSAPTRLVQEKAQKSMAEK